MTEFCVCVYFFALLTHLNHVFRHLMIMRYTFINGHAFNFIHSIHSFSLPFTISNSVQFYSLILIQSHQSLFCPGFQLNLFELAGFGCDGGVEEASTAINDQMKCSVLFILFAFQLHHFNGKS